METEDQRKDRERLDSYIKRESLCSIMNNTKWKKLRSLMLNERKRMPVWRVMCLRDVREEVSRWDGDWYYHLPEYKYIEWLEINPIHRERKGVLLEDKVTDNTNYLISLLKDNSILFSIENECLRVWGYQRPGHAIKFV